ncbi:uncharacterized protein RCC_03891 [Ramularia collo-cygni]|uniref:Uncharacterized protein n=1 Tax=Ramularia collo-cygni TaxID=112498 RepID=A0A2D3VC30_9PEZI|nr:uncharacterized protein RCC_03891 [Ramularia collo-cygni]CZT18053.1 uncharacterized protein RCC_03891 [Ramularia collo-cygni]
MASGLWQAAPAKVETNVTPQMANSIPEQASPVEAKDSLFLSNDAASSTSSRHSSFNDIRRPMMKSPDFGPDAAERRASNVAMGRTAAFLCNNSR